MRIPILFLTLLVGCFSFPAFASTTDGLTPAVETVCSGLEGVDDTKFGICNAYCESQDCDDPLHRSSDKACQALMKKWDALLVSQPFPCQVGNPVITVSKAVNADLVTGFITVGADVIYTFTIVNEGGNVNFKDIVLTDVTIPDALDNCEAALSGLVLGVGNTFICTSDVGEIKALVGPHTNVAHVTANTIYNQLVPADDSEVVTYTGIVEVVCPAGCTAVVNAVIQAFSIGDWDPADCTYTPESSSFSYLDLLQVDADGDGPEFFSNRIRTTLRSEPDVGTFGCFTRINGVLSFAEDVTTQAELDACQNDIVAGMSCNVDPNP